MDIIIRPQDLLAGYNVNFHIQADINQTQTAYVTCSKDKAGTIVSYDLYVYKQKCRDIYNQTPYPLQHISFESFFLGVFIHEMLHILNNTLNYVPSNADNNIMHYIWNVIFDSHDEYKGAYWFPSYNQYIQLVLQGIRQVSPAVATSDLDIDLQTWYYLVRFGVQHPNCDPDFFNFCVQVSLPGIRGTSQDALDAACAVYEYLRVKHRSSDVWKEAFNNDQTGEQAITGPMIDTLKAMPTVMQSSGDGFDNDSKRAGFENVQVTYDFSDNSFYLSTVQEFLDQIDEIASRFLRFLDAPELVKSTDGDMGLSLPDQMALYQASYTGEDVMAYYRNLIHRPDIDVVVMHDISGSTSGQSREYAQACVIFFAAFEKITGVRLAYIRFNGGANTLFTFDEDIKKSALDPTSSGGTAILPALMLSHEFDWRGETRLQFIITDGEWYDDDEGLTMIEAMRRDSNIHTYILEVVGDYRDQTPFAVRVPYAYKTTLPHLSTKLMNRLILDILKDRGQA